MPNFVDDLTDLPGPKTQVTPVPEGEEDNALSADDYNQNRQAAYDMRGAILDLRDATPTQFDDDDPGIVPASGGGTSNFLRADGSWTTPAVTNVTDGDKGDITISSGAWAIDANAVSDTKLRDSAALSVIGRSANSTGDPADIAAGSDGDVLRRSGTALGFGSIPESSVTNLVADLASRLTAQYPFFGDGLDGPLTFDGTTTVLGIVPTGSPGNYVYVLTKDICGTTIIINSGVSVRFAGYRMMATISIENNGTKVGNYGIDSTSVSAAGATGAGVIATGVSGVAGKVGPGVGVNGTASGGVYTGWTTLVAAAAGATGGTGQGSGGASVGGNNGGTGGALTIATQAGGRSSLKTGMTGEVERGTTQLTWASSGGSGAVVGGATGNSGGTGGGGSLTYIGAPLITGTGRFTSKGGDAGPSTLGNSTGVGGSAGSGGGWMYVVYCTRTGSLTIDADGGTGANGAGTGGTGPNGGAGTVTLKNVTGDGT